MKIKRLGRTGLDVSILTFGCGAVGGLMTKGEAADQDRAVAWALDHGINHFDTAPGYGDGTSETNLGRALAGRTGDVVVSTKVRLWDADRATLEAAIRTSIDASLERLQRDHVDLLQLHNRVALEPDGDVFGVDEIIGEVVPMLERLKQEGKTRFVGFTANGETEALQKVVASERFDTAQIFYNLLTPSAGEAVPETHPGQDYRELMLRAHEAGMGTIGVRALAGGALSGRGERHPLSMQRVQPIGSAAEFETDVERALKFQPLIEEGHAESLAELALRFVITEPSPSTAEIGIATLEQLQFAADAVNRGPLSDDALAAIGAIRAQF